MDRPARRWLLGPLPDLLFGCGVAYGLVLAALVIAQPAAGSALLVAQLAILFTSVPHYGATLLRAYQTGAAHRRFALWLTVPVALVYAVGLHQIAVASALVTLYLTWSPWHYSSQNYGIALMFLRRRGVAITPLTRGLLRASFVLSFALVTLTMHGAGAVPPEDPAYLMSGDVRFIPLGVPAAINAIAVPVLAVADAIALCGALVLLLRSARLADLLPTLLLAVTQALWFTLPLLLRLGGAPPAWLGANSYVLIAVGHSVQYLWIAAYFARTSTNGARSHAVYLSATLLAGAALWFIPARMFSPDALGRLPWDAGLAIVTSAALNLHHFILDGVIWKLREPAVAKVLIDDAGQSTAPPPRRRRWTLATVGAACFAVSLFGLVEEELGFRRAYLGGDLERLETSVARMTILGRDGPRQRVAVGMLRSKRGDAAGALQAFERSRQLQPLAAAWLGEALVHERRGDRAAALKAYRAALQLNPQAPGARERVAVLEAAAR